MSISSFVTLLSLLTLTYILFRYSAQGLDRKKRRLRFLQEAKPIRTLTIDESEALKSQLRSLGRGKLKLRNEEVYSLCGEYAHYKFYIQGARESHQTIDGIEVLFPYDSKHCVREDSINETEVVLAGRYAIVVSINDQFDLVSRRVHSALRKQADAQWASGATGPLISVEGPESSPAGLSEEKCPRNVVLDSQREETPQETVAKLDKSKGFLSALLWAIAFFIVFYTLEEDGSFHSLWIYAAIISGLLGVLQFIYAQNLLSADKVNILSGNLYRSEQTLTSNERQLPLFSLEGLPHQFTLPEHWHPVANSLVGQNVTIEMRVEDHTVIALGDQLSITRDISRVRPVYWKRHMLPALVALVALWGSVILMLAEAQLSPTERFLKDFREATVNNPQDIVRQRAMTRQLRHLSLHGEVEPEENNSDALTILSIAGTLLIFHGAGLLLGRKEDQIRKEQLELSIQQSLQR